LPSWVNRLSNWFNSQVEGESLVLGIHVSKESGSVGRSKRSVLSSSSPWVEGNVSAGEVQVVTWDLRSDVDCGNSNVRSIPLNREVIDGVVASISLELNLEEEASRSSIKFGNQISGEVINGRGGIVESRGLSSVARKNSVLGSWRRKCSKSKFCRRKRSNKEG